MSHTPVASSVADVHDLVVALARDVEQRWQDRADDASFGRAAADALTAAELPARLPVGVVLTYLAAWPGLPPVVAGENEYGQPTVTVWRSADFHIEVIVWEMGAIALHDHVNAGAFVPLEGERFHSRYEFTPTGTWADTFTVGRLQLRHGEVLGPGDARGILPGTAFLHDLVFCAERCTTVSIRRRASSGDSASYLLPGIRVPNDATWGRRARALRHLRDADEVVWRSAVERMVCDGPDTALFALLELCEVVAPGQLGPVVRRVVERWGGDLEWWAGLVAEQVRRGRLERLLAGTGPPARLALAGLRAGVDGAAAASMGIDRPALPDDQHHTMARSRAALGWD